MGRSSQEQAQKNRQKIVECAARLFREFGVDNVSVNYTASGIPEPGTWLLLVGGLISLGVAFLLRNPVSSIG